MGDDMTPDDPTRTGAQGSLADVAPGLFPGDVVPDELVGYRVPSACQIAGITYRQLDYWARTSLVVPSIRGAAGSGSQRLYSFKDILVLKIVKRLLDTGIKSQLSESMLENYGTALGLLTSALGAHLTWTLPFGLLIMFAVFNRFNPAYEEAARDLGATPWQTFRHVVLPLIGPSVVGIGMFGFTLSWDEIARTSQAIGDVNTLPLELQGLTSTVTTPAIYALVLGLAAASAQALLRGRTLRVPPMPLMQGAR